MIPTLFSFNSSYDKFIISFAKCQYFSTSHNWAVWAKDLAASYHPDTIRYFFIANGREKRDTDFSWREFKEQNNSELVGAWGNFVNRTLAFIAKYLDNKIPSASFSPILNEKLDLAYQTVGTQIEHRQFKDALSSAFSILLHNLQPAFQEILSPNRVLLPSDCR